MVKKSKVILGLLMFFAAGGANAEISTVVKNVTAEAVASVMDTPCYVRTRELRGLFAEAGMNITNTDSAYCQLDVGGFVSIVLNGNDYISKMPVDWFTEHQDNPEYVAHALPESAKDASLALRNLVDAEDRASAEAAADAKLSEAERYSKHSRGSDIGGSVGGASIFGLAGAVGGSLFGSMFDSNKKGKTPVGLTHLTADIAIKNVGGQLDHLKIEVYAASTSKEHPVDLLRAAVKRVVSEIQAKDDASKKASSDKAIAPTVAASYEVKK